LAFFPYEVQGFLRSFFNTRYFGCQVVSNTEKVVPFTDFEIYKRELPNAIPTSYDRGHFNTENFSELIETIKAIDH